MGHFFALNDGRTDVGEDSGNGPGDPDVWWGYQWPTKRRFNKVVYYPGTQADSMGGWFAAGPWIENRQGATWEPLTALPTPAYSNDYTALEQDFYTFEFDEVESDGVRIRGMAGGKHVYTSIAELEVWLDTK